MDPALVECDSEVGEANHHANHERLVSDSCGEHLGSIARWNFLKNYQHNSRVLVYPLQGGFGIRMPDRGLGR
jgi:hypothetical protein